MYRESGARPWSTGRPGYRPRSFSSKLVEVLLARLGRIAAERERSTGRLLVPDAEVRRFRPDRLKAVIKLTCARTDKTPATARKWVYRKRKEGLSLEEIASSLVKRAPR